MASEVAHGITLCLVDAGGNETQIPLVDYDAGVWHTFVPGVGHGQAYGYRAAGPYDPATESAATRPSCCSTRTPGPLPAR